ncbi:DHHC palmitoyltransferase-domain-containing protein [Desarmillaria tabescens]|uniref:Palmitoyltransferase n=1 Tax=Armillaria tabescens TaxID=1929756 RepID=A0AA39NPH7_ARMTA|nr:DHHC palmitoyltransferase-domain-containing protein [Desarmillaria tabescens]KAK0469401.1 DHHC palmitoyltransferase-domain-containing protein [Desarmillaria tabescens]
MICSRTVFRCFKTLERLGDRVTGAAGPLFVALAVILMSIGTVAFFDVISPSLPLPLLTIPPCVLVAVNMWTHYWWVCTVPPGFVDGDVSPIRGLWAAKRKRVGVNARTTKAGLTKCSKCAMMRPERAHHCRICNKCVLKYDHHCPVRINQCVGLHNERHFVMFMAYLVIATFAFVLFGYPQLLVALGLGMHVSWRYRVSLTLYLLIYILSAVLCLAVGIMCAWHLTAISAAETSVESQDYEVYKRVARNRGDVFVNSYDLGRRKNLQLFFNLEEYPLYTLIIPLRLQPYTDGRWWARKDGYDEHGGIRRGEELTDDDDDE